MRKWLIYALLWMLSGNLFAQEKFLNLSSDPAFGSALRVASTADGGFAVFSLDSLKISKYNRCGISEWSFKFDVPERHIWMSDFISLGDGGFAFITRARHAGLYSTVVAKLDDAGAVVWSKVIYHPDYTQFSYTLSEDSQGNLFLFANVENIQNNAVRNLLCKLRPDGNLMWSRFYNHGGTWGGAITTSDDGVLARTGNRFIKTDDQGQVLWTAQSLGNSYYYRAPVEVEDGYIFSGYKNGSQEILFYKLDLMGNLLWGSRKQVDYTGNPPVLRKKANGNVAGVFNKFISGLNYTTIAEFDADLELVQQKTLHSEGLNLSLFGTDVCFPQDETPVVVGYSGAAAIPFVGKLDETTHLNCDTNLTLMTITTEPVTASLISTNVSSPNFTIINFAMASAAFSTTETTLCKFPKTLNLGNDTIFCANADLTLRNLTFHTFDSYLWSTGATTAAITVNTPGTYWLKATYNCGQDTVTDTVEVSVLPVKEAELPADSMHCDTAPVALFAPDCDSCIFSWSNGSNAAATEVEGAGIHWLTVFNPNGCVSTDSIHIRHDDCPDDFEVPNIFTPNGDGINDWFYIDDPGIVQLRTRIFDRWGRQIHATNHPTINWDGGDRPEGVYYWILDYVYISGKTGERKGWVVLMR